MPQNFGGMAISPRSNGEHIIPFNVVDSVLASSPGTPVYNRLAKQRRNSMTKNSVGEHSLVLFCKKRFYVLNRSKDRKVG